MATTVAIKRCKGCIFWQLHHGTVENEAIRRMMNIQVPKRHGHACTLRLHTINDPKADDGKRDIPSMQPTDKPGPKFGKRIGPNGVCKHHTAKRPPYRKPKPVETVGDALPLAAAIAPVRGDEGSTHQLAAAE